MNSQIRRGFFQLTSIFPVLFLSAIFLPAGAVADDVPRFTSAILTPPPPATPRINGPGVFGVRPDAPFLYTIPATGDRPMEFRDRKSVV